MKPENKRIVVVTGSSRGIGAATAIKAAELGYEVCINFVKNESAALNVAERIRSHHGKCIVVKADMSKEKEVIRLFEEVDKKLGTVTALVNNVGVVREKARLSEMTGDRISDILTANVLSCLLCSREAVRRMGISFGGNGGNIVNVSSAASRLGASGEYIDYAASKGAMDTLTIGLSKEVASDGIRVNSVRPGYIFTDIHANSGDPERVEKLAKSLPMQRGGDSREVADAILWLLSEEASYVTGSFIDLAGGR
ncbi:MAG: SDR family oxidoreductase [Gammaproteobacteria bacterium]|nr:SDR family oxidoreductase [Gammaproteobacteria bacterium]MYA66660.1 SDR family oxidoreductase [Gammaproteobacteria bacterium]MYH46847.1 SDR family oxidoreductase [Gammaproteobacteria bacterium]MYL13553.1 SDR family oxidoreductase [Gammaproteobacteria bacterium]